MVGVAGIVFMALAIMGRRSVDIGKPRKEAAGAHTGDGQGTQMAAFVTLSGVGFLDSATRGSALVFLPFVMDSKGMSTGQISVMLVLLFAGGAAGKFVCGWLGDRYGSVSLIWGTKGLTASLLLLSLAAPPLAMAPLMLAMGIGLNGTSSVLYATVAEFVPPGRRARLYGSFYTTNEVGTVVAPLVYGFIADLANLRAAIVVMGLVTTAILPVSLMLNRYLRPRLAASRPGRV